MDTHNPLDLAHRTMHSARLPAYRLLPIGATRPQGWILNQLKIDLEKGLKGHFPKITTNVSHNLFASQSRQAGTWVAGARGHQEKAWWAGEHEGYWIDSVTRSAILTGNAEWMKFVAGWMERVIEKFGKSGYIGIYDEATRLPDRGFDGEMWTQSRAFQAMLAWFEFTGDQRIVEAVMATVRMTIDHYRHLGTYFGRPDPDGGVTHGVGYMDTLEWLWRLTRDPYFAEAAVWLYADYSENAPETFDDMTVRNLCDPEYPWCDHGAHIAEALHLPAIAHFHSGRADFDAAARQVLPKLLRHSNPGGGIAIGYLEAVAGSRGGGHTLNENCGQVQALMSLNRLAQYSPEALIGTWQERCILNVVQGARFHPADHAVIYLSRDNRLHAADPKALGGREVFSACHEAAACCVLNLPRAMPYFVEGMRLVNDAEVLVNGYGPCETRFTVQGVSIRIVENGTYPFSDQIEFLIEPDRPCRFRINLRIPPNTGHIKVDTDTDAEISWGDEFLSVDAEWCRGAKLLINFDFQVVRKIQHDGCEAYWMWGPLLFCLPIESLKSPCVPIDANANDPSGFHEYRVEAKSIVGWELTAGLDSAFRAVKIPGDPEYPWCLPPIALDGHLYDRSGNRVDVRLVPFGATVLRRTTFPLHHLISADPGGTPESSRVTVADDPMREF